MHDTLAPIVIFVYRRDVGQLIETLKQDPLAGQSDIIVFSDGAKDAKARSDVKNVRASLKGIDGFKSVRIVEASHNKGLATSIIDGVTEVIAQYGKIIVLEDDLVVAEDFLQYMNTALDFYEKDGTIWSVSGYSAKLPCLVHYAHDLYLAPRVNSWGWATWKSRWDKIDWEINDWEALKRNRQMQRQFNLGGNDLFRMLELQMNGKIDSWAIRWSYNQFKNDMYTVYPVVSKVLNEGFDDEKGMHNNYTASSKWSVVLQGAHAVKFEKLKADPVILRCFERYYDLGLKTTVGYFLKKHGGYGIAKKLMKLINR